MYAVISGWCSEELHVTFFETKEKAERYAKKDYNDAANSGDYYPDNETRIGLSEILNTDKVFNGTYHCFIVEISDIKQLLVDNVPVSFPLLPKKETKKKKNEKAK
jgi:hypothetical protein